MVVLIRELVDKSLSNTTKTLLMKKMSPNNDVEMVIDLVDDLFNNCDNYDEGHTLVSNTHHPRSPSLFSSDSKEDYATRVQRESDRMVEDDLITPTNSPQLEYVTPKSKSTQVSKAAKSLY